MSEGAATLIHRYRPAHDNPDGPREGLTRPVAPVTSRSNTIVAAGLVVLITAAGPALDRLAARRAKA